MSPQSPRNSQTPRTDAAASFSDTFDGIKLFRHESGNVVEIEFARQLEIENNELRRRIADLECERGDVQSEW